LKERLSRLEQREIKKRQLVLESMAEIGDTTLEQPDFTLSVRGRAVSGGGERERNPKRFSLTAR